MDVKEIFAKAEGGTLTYDQFKELAKANNAKFTDLSEGKYVDKQKYDDDIKAKDTQIETLNGTITTRDTDLASLQEKLNNAGTDSTKLAQLSADFTTLQGKYEADIKDYEARMKRQSYEFAVKEFANTKNFTSQAAKRDFVNSMIAKNLQMDGTKILGDEDFATSYLAENSDAFVVESDPTPAPTPQPSVPTFVQPTPGPSPEPESGFHFNFTGVRPKE